MGLRSHSLRNRRKFQRCSQSPLQTGFNVVLLLANLSSKPSLFYLNLILFAIEGEHLVYPRPPFFLSHNPRGTRSTAEEAISIRGRP